VALLLLMVPVVGLSITLSRAVRRRYNPAVSRRFLTTVLTFGAPR
jgi:hypothetical protein